MAVDLITTNLVEAAEHRFSSGFSVSETTLVKFTELYNLAVESFRISLKRYGGQESGDDKSVSKDVFKDQLLEVRSHLMQRLSAPDDMRIPVYRFESEVLEAIRRLHALARRLERRAE
jgi:phosphate:Na+ symporter